jgi:hypothetical protein
MHTLTEEAWIQDILKVEERNEKGEVSIKDKA